MKVAHHVSGGFTYRKRNQSAKGRLKSPQSLPMKEISWMIFDGAKPRDLLFFLFVQEVNSDKGRSRAGGYLFTAPTQS